MILEKCYKILRAVSSDQGRPALCNVYFTGDRLVATDGKILAVVPVEFEAGDVAGMISKKALNEARAIAQGKSPEFSVQLNATHAIAGDVSVKRSQDIFPDYQVVLNKARAANGDVVFNINPLLLVRLAAALGSPAGVQLKVSNERGQPILVTPLDGDGLSEGVLMPLTK